MSVISGFDYKKLAGVRTKVKKVLDNKVIEPNNIKSFKLHEHFNLNGYPIAIVTVKATYDPNATAGVRIRWLYSPNDIDYDNPTEAEAQGNYEDLTFEAGSTTQRTVIIPILSNYTTVEIINLDAYYSVTVSAWLWIMR